MTKATITIFVVGAMLLSSLGIGSGLLGGTNANTTTGVGVTTTGTNTSANINNQTGADVLGNTVQSTTGISAQVGL